MSRSQRSFNFSFPFLPRTNLCIYPDLYPSFPHERSEMDLQAFQPFFVAVAIADKNLRRSRFYIPHVLNICTRAWKRLLFQVQCWAVDRTGAATLASTSRGRPRPLSTRSPICKQLPRPGISLDSSLGTFCRENVLKEEKDVQHKESRFRGCGRSPEGD
jgi:hypothetical protein